MSTLLGERKRTRPLALVRPGSYHGAMSSVVKKSHSFEAGQYSRLVEVSRSRELTPSAALGEAVNLWLKQQEGLAAVARWEQQYGPISDAALAEADSILDSAGIGS